MEEIQTRILNFISTWDSGIMLMKSSVFLFLTAGLVLLFRDLRMFRNMAGMLRRTRADINAASRQRSLAGRQKLLALQQEHSLWYSIEKQLQYSGLGIRFPGLTAEWWLVGNAVCAAIIFLVTALAGGLFPAAAAVLAAGLAEGYVMRRLRETNLKRTENNLTRLLDFLGNYSITAGEVTSIFNQVSRYMEEPLKSALDACCYEASTTGDASAALLTMAERIEHPKFKELARNLEISIRYCADFKALVNGSRRSLREYLRMAQERKGMLREAMINLVLLLGMSAAVLMIVGSLTGISVWQLVTGTLPGRAGIGVVLFIGLMFRGQLRRACR